MVTTKHICDICNKIFPEDRLEEAKKHEKIPVSEGNYHGMVFRYQNENDDHYVFLVKGNKLSPAHERIYNHSEMNVEELKLAKYGANDLIHLPSDERWSISDIKTMIQNKNLQSITNEELSRINDLRNKGFIDNHYTSQYKGIWETG